MSDELDAYGKLPVGWTLHSYHASVAVVQDITRRVTVLFMHESGTHVELTFHEKPSYEGLIRLLDFALTVDTGSGHVQIVKPDKPHTGEHDAGDGIRNLRDGAPGGGEVHSA